MAYITGVEPVGEIATELSTVCGLRSRPRVGFSIELIDEEYVWRMKRWQGLGR